MKTCFFVVMMAACLSLSSPGEGAEFFAGAAKIDITPPLEWDYSLGGYGERMSKPAEGVHDRIWARAVVFQQGEKKFALVTTDVLGIPPNVKPELLEKLEDSWSAENVMVFASHSHASIDMTTLNDKNTLGIPQIGIFNRKVLDYFLANLSKVITEAEKNLKPARVGTGQTELQGLNRNRRGSDFVDRELTVTRIESRAGRPIAAIVNWTAHPTLMGAEDMYVSGGWPGYLQREMEQLVDNGVVALYLNGAEGDISPVAQPAGSHYEQAEIYGREIAKHALELYQKVTPKQVETFSFARSDIQLPQRQAHPQFKQTGGAEYGITDEVMQVILGVISPPQTHTTALRLNDLVIAGVPGELASELGLKIKSGLRQAGIKHPVIGGFANEWISYILPADEYEKGGYEASISFYGPELGRVVVDAVLGNASSLSLPK